MPAGISKAKGRRNSKSKRSPTFQAYPAKAGKRKVYGKDSKRKTKQFPDGKTVNGKPVYVMGQSNYDGYMFNPQWKTGDPVMIPRR